MRPSPFGRVGDRRDFLVAPRGVLRTVREPHPGVFVFDLFKPTLCETVSWAASVIRASRKEPPPNSMNKYGTTLDEPEVERWLREVMSAYVMPIARKHYPDFGALKRPYGFTVDYSSKQRSLSEHIDGPSAVTLNVCLGGDFKGGALVLLNRRCKRHEDIPTRPEEVFEIEQKIGQAIVHLGHHQHRARQITSGTRSNLILWCPAPRMGRGHPTWCDA
jgi:hypothetical protein